MAIEEPKVTGAAAGADYLAKRTLRSGSAGWVLLAGLGVSYVISGDYAGWNSGIAEGGSAVCWSQQC